MSFFTANLQMPVAATIKASLNVVSKAKFYSSLKNLRPILLVANMPHPEAICK